jgi:hypothetical protein
MCSYVRIMKTLVERALPLARRVDDLLRHALGARFSVDEAAPARSQSWAFENDPLVLDRCSIESVRHATGALPRLAVRIKEHEAEGRSELDLSEVVATVCAQVADDAVESGALRMGSSGNKGVVRPRGWPAVSQRFVPACAGGAVRT